MFIENVKLTSLKAAEIFAKTAFPKPKRIEAWKDDTFRLNDVPGWFRAERCPSGWNVLKVAQETPTWRQVKSRVRQECTYDIGGEA